MATPITRRLERKPDGMLKVVYVDTHTGQEVNNPFSGDYTLIEQGSNLDFMMNGNEGAQKQKDPTPSTVPTDKVSPQFNGTSAADQNNDPYADIGTRGAANNFGFIDKPGIMSFAGMLPGPLGMAGKMANGVVNANNVAAVNSARGFLGLDPVSALQAGKGIISNNKGYVADAKIGSTPYSIGLDAVDPVGRTSLTPNEARTRSLVTNQPITEMTRQERKQNVAAFKEANPNAKQGLLGKAASAIGKVADVIGNALKSPAPGTVSNVTSTEAGLTVDVTHPDGKVSHFTNLESTNVTPGQQVNAGTVVGAVDPTRTDDTKEHYSLEDENGQKIDPSAIENTPGFDPNALDARTASEISKGISPDRMSNSAFANLAGQVDTVKGLNALSPEDVAQGNFLDVSPNFGPAPAIDSYASFANPGFNPNGFVSGVNAPSAPAPSNQPTYDASNPYGTIDGIGAVPGPVEQAANTMSPSINTQNASNISVDKANGLSMASLSSLGLNNPTQAEREAIGNMIAGELAPDTLSALADPNDPAHAAAMSAAAAIAGVVDNRAASGLGIMGAVNAHNTKGTYAFSSMKPGKALDITNQNFSKYSNAIMGAVNGYYAGTNPSPVPNANHYYNPEIANPAWGAKMVDPSMVGYHVFGDIPNAFTPATGFNNFALGNLNKDVQNATNVGAINDINSVVGNSPTAQAGFNIAHTAPNFMSQQDVVSAINTGVANNPYSAMGAAIAGSAPTGFDPGRFAGPVTGPSTNVDPGRFSGPSVGTFDPGRFAGPTIGSMSFNDPFDTSRVTDVGNRFGNVNTARESSSFDGGRFGGVGQSNASTSVGREGYDGGFSGIDSSAGSGGWASGSPGYGGTPGGRGGDASASVGGQGRDGGYSGIDSSAGYGFDGGGSSSYGGGGFNSDGSSNSSGGGFNAGSGANSNGGFGNSGLGGGSGVGGSYGGGQSASEASGAAHGGQSSAGTGGAGGTNEGGLGGWGGW